MPASPQGLVELDQSNEFVRLDLCQPQFSRKGIRLVGQHFQVVGGPGLGAHLWEPCTILGSFEQMFLLDPELSILAIRISPTDQFSCDLAVNLLDLELAVEPHCSPVHLLATPPASLLSTHRDLWRSRI